MCDVTPCSLEEQRMQSGPELRRETKDSFFWVFCLFVCLFVCLFFVLFFGVFCFFFVFCFFLFFVVVFLLFQRATPTFTSIATFESESKTVSE